jgi:hypothetical protein
MHEYDPEHLVTERTVAERLGSDPDAEHTESGISVHTLRKYRSQGRGPKYLKLGDGPRAAVRYRWGDILEWLARYAVEPGQQPEGEVRHAAGAAQ